MTTLRPASSVSLLADRLKLSSINESTLDTPTATQLVAVDQTTLYIRRNSSNRIRGYQSPGHVAGPLQLLSERSHQNPTESQSMSCVSPSVPDDNSFPVPSNPRDSHVRNLNWQTTRRAGGFGDHAQFYPASAPTSSAPDTYSPFMSAFMFTSPSQLSSLNSCLETSCTTIPLATSMTGRPSFCPVSSHYCCCCATNGHHIPCKRACRSWSASCSMNHLGPNHPTSRDAIVLETYRNTLPRPIAIRLIPTDKARVRDDASSRPTLAGVLLRPKQRDLMHCQPSRLSWHHPISYSGATVPSHAPIPGSHVPHSGHTSAVCATSDHFAVLSPSTAAIAIATGTTCNTRASVARLSGSNSEPDSNSPDLNRFTPTHGRCDSAHDDTTPCLDCSTSSNANSFASSGPFPVPTPSSGFHDTPFAYFSEASSLPECIRLGPKHVEFSVGDCHSPAYVPSNSGTAFCAFGGASSTAIDDIHNPVTKQAHMDLPQAIVCSRCHSQPMSPPDLMLHNRNHSAKLTEDHSPTKSHVPAGLKRRRGPSGETDLPPLPTDELASSYATCFCYSDLPVFTSNSQCSLAHHTDIIAPHTNSTIRALFSDDSPATGSCAGDVFVFGSSVPKSDIASVSPTISPRFHSDGLSTRESHLSIMSCCLCDLYQSTDVISSVNENDVSQQHHHHHWSQSTISIPRPASLSEPMIEQRCRHMCVQLSDLSESLEEEKDYETLETVIREDARSVTDACLKRSKHVTVLSPPIFDVTFEPIHDGEDCDQSVEPTLDPCCIPPPDERFGSGLLVSPCAQVSSKPMDDPANLIIALSSSDSDGDEDQVLSPQLLRQPDGYIHNASFTLETSVAPNQLIDLALIEKN